MDRGDWQTTVHGVTKSRIQRNDQHFNTLLQYIQTLNHYIIHLKLTARCACMLSCSVVSDSLQPHGLYPARLLHPWDFPDKDTGVGCHLILQRIFLTQGSNPGLPHCRQTVYRLSHQGNHEWLKTFSILKQHPLKSFGDYMNMNQEKEQSITFKVLVFGCN